MAISVASTASADFATSSSVTITKPTGLAENDLLIACLAGDANIDTAAGWTTVNETTANGFTHIQYKIADSGDVAASNFTFTNSGSTNNIGGALLRITGHAPTALFSGNGIDDYNNSATAFDFSFTGFTPIANNSLLVAVVFAYQTTTDTDGGVSGYTINGTNPTWTEVADFGIDDAGTDMHYAVAYAVQTTASEINTFDATYSDVDASTDYGMTLAALSPQTDINVTSQHLSVSPAFHAVDPQVGVSASQSGHLAVSPTFFSGSATAGTNNWTNITRPTGTVEQQNAVFMDDNNHVFMDGNNKIYREASDNAWTNETRP